MRIGKICIPYDLICMSMRKSSVSLLVVRRNQVGPAIYPWLHHPLFSRGRAGPSPLSV